MFAVLCLAVLCCCSWGHNVYSRAGLNIRVYEFSFYFLPLLWCHNGHDGVSNHQPHHCLPNRLLRRRSKKTAKLCVTGLCAGNSPGPVNSPPKWPVTRNIFPFDDVIVHYISSTAQPTPCASSYTQWPCGVLDSLVSYVAKRPFAEWADIAVQWDCFLTVNPILTEWW